MKRFFLLGLLLCASIAGAVELPATVGSISNWNSRKPLELATSFHSYVMDQDIDNVEYATSPQCVEAIRSHINSGGDFLSQIVLKYSSKISEFPRKDTTSGVYYHYTTAVEPLQQIAQNKTYADLFSYPRKIKEHPEARHRNYTITRKLFLFVAADSESSKSYGPGLFKFSLNPNDLVVYSYGDKPGMEISREEIVKQIQNEMIAKNKNLSVCYDDYFAIEGGDGGEQPILMVLAMEASGASAIAYYGINSKAIYGDKDYQWLQIIGPWVIQDMTFDSVRTEN